MELTGKVIAVLEARSGQSQRTGNPWMIQEYVLEVPGTYPRKMMFNVFGEDRIKQFNIQQNDEITVSFDIDAREFNGRWYNDIRAYNVQRGVVAPAAQPAPAAQTFGAQPAPAAAAAAPAAEAAPFPPASEAPAEGSADDLPF